MWKYIYKVLNIDEYSLKIQLFYLNTDFRNSYLKPTMIKIINLTPMNYIDELDFNVIHKGKLKERLNLNET